jgi:hypothetical protein
MSGNKPQINADYADRNKGNSIGLIRVNPRKSAADLLRRSNTQVVSLTVGLLTLSSANEFRCQPTNRN